MTDLEKATLEELEELGFKRCNCTFLNEKYRAIRVDKLDDRIVVVRYTQQEKDNLYHYDGRVEFGSDGVMRMYR